MSESGGSVPKSSDLYIGVVDLFGIVLPGAIIVFLIQYGISVRHEGLYRLEGVRGWVAFIVLSYIVGHLVSAIGSWVLDGIYDYPYKLSKDNEDYCRFRNRALVLNKTILDGFYCEDDNVLEWSTAFVRLGSAAAATEIDRLDADSKFFRSLTIVLILGWPIYACLRDPWHVRAWFTWLTLAPIVFLYSYVEWKRHSKKYKAFRDGIADILKRRKERIKKSARNELEKRLAAKQPGGGTLVTSFLKRVVGPLPDPESEIKGMVSFTDSPAGIISDMFEKIGSSEAAANGKLAAPFRRASIFTAVVWMALTIGTALLVPIAASQQGCGWLCLVLHAVGSAIYGGLTLFSAFRYMELRLKRTTLTYRSVIALSKSPQLISPTALHTPDK